MSVLVKSALTLFPVLPQGTVVSLVATFEKGVIVLQILLFSLGKYKFGIMFNSFVHVVLRCDVYNITYSTIL